MKKMAMVAVGGAVGLVLTLGIADVAGAAPATTSTAGTTGTTTPAVTTPTKPTVLTGPQIWSIVRPRHRVDCARATKQLKRIQAAETAADKRMGRWRTMQTRNEAREGPIAARRVKDSSVRVKGFQKLVSDAQALIRRIDTKCSLTSPAT